MSFIYVLILISLAVKIQYSIYKSKAFQNLSYECYFSKSELTEGDELELVEIVTNKKLLPLPWLRSEITSSKWLDFASAQSLITEETRFVPSFFTIKSYSRTTRKWKVKCLKRGVYNINKVVLITTDLLGIASTSQSFDINTTLTVLPNPADLTADFESAQKLLGDVTVKRHYIDDPFYRAGIKEYTERDPINRIHWKATAKAQKLMVHNNQFTADQDLLVILNIQSREYETKGVIDSEKIENGIKICAGFFESTLITGMPVRFVANWSPDDTREPYISNSYHGDEHVCDLMETLSSIALRSSDAFSTFLVNTCLPIEASDIVIVTSYLSDFIYDFVREKAEIGTNVKIMYTSPLTDEPVPDDIMVYGYSGKENSVI